METRRQFEAFLRKSNLSKNTITSYLWTVAYFEAHYDEISKENLMAYKGFRLELGETIPLLQ